MESSANPSQGSAGGSTVVIATAAGPVGAEEVAVIEANVVVPKKRRLSLPSSKVKWHQQHWTQLDNGHRKCNNSTLVWKPFY